MAMLLILVGTFATLVLGQAVRNTHRDIKTLQAFMVSAENVQPNFERSLTVYTQETQHVIDFLISVRPDTEQEYITFIANVEEIGQELSLNIDLESREALVAADSNENTLDYVIQFYGSYSNLTDFLSELEALPYFIKVDQVDFSEPDFRGDSDGNVLPNISIKIKLYVQ